MRLAIANQTGERWVLAHRQCSLADGLTPTARLRCRKQERGGMDALKQLIARLPDEQLLLLGLTAVFVLGVGSQWMA